MKDIKETVQNYFKAYLQADAELLMKAFDENVRLLTVDDDKIEVTSMGDWIQNIRSRKEKGDIRQGTTEIVSVDVSGSAATVKATLVFPNLRFTDYLSLLRLANEWKIVGKIYTVEKSVG